MLVSRENPVLKPKAEIQARYATYRAIPAASDRVRPRRHTASLRPFHPEAYLLQPVLYDWSFLDWSNALGIPVEVGTGR
jgi:hypothetical protein